jgi:hypothetical protein
MKITAIESMLPGLIISLLAILFGTGAGIAFGMVEEEIKFYFLTTVKAHPEIHGEGGKAMAKPSKDAWRYIQRAHFHAQGLGALGVSIILVLALTRASRKTKTFLSLGIGLGVFLYPFCWLIAGLRIPTIGKHAAKASVDWLAGISIPLFFGGLCGVLVILLLSWMTVMREKPIH